MRVVALDIATQTGIAVGDVGGDPRAWSVDLGKGDEARGAKLLGVVDRLLRDERPDLVVVEAPIGGPNASHLLIGLAFVAKSVCKARGVHADSVHISSVRKHFLGSVPTTRGQSAKNKADAKKAIKQMVVHRCRLLGWDVPDHDAADAAACWDFACARHGQHQAHRSTPLFAKGARQ
ncbi:hypothetical protein JANAI62_03860 [Jannaschia pagri]|uniref:Uncharacterized protein n=1 Tax=Jannaschia pagri TaxID=2829797 RepID=A0ABQ4NH58_9RHOB|nr:MULTISPECIES: hypothetical protein [unclassified Jannaschia]GIT90131.1 hypothetical protein JANAI61_05890 [Jannaschia sp. AI_61]GIT93763.1 hypothetical protein JANAI62_03860 [Jannaschia sp. AI_62]